MLRNPLFKKYSVCVIWFFGLVLGIIIAHGSKALIAPNLRGDIFMPVSSFTSVLISSFIPFIVLLPIVFFRKRVLLHIFLFLRAFVHSYSIFTISFIQHGYAIFPLWIQLLSSCCCSALIIFVALSDGCIVKQKGIDFFLSCSVLLFAVCMIDRLIFGFVF